MDHSLPDIFNTDIITTSQDVFWETALADSLSLNDTLVISIPYIKGGAEETQLIKMLSACKLQATQYSVLQLHEGQQVAWHLLRERTQATKVLLLGVLPARLGINAMMIPHEVNNFDGVQWMPTFSLDQIGNNAQLKQQLWVNVFQKVYL